MDTYKTAAGRHCSVTSVAHTSADGGGSGPHPFDEQRIGLPVSEMRRAAPPLVLAGELKRRLDEFATRVTAGR
jgi:hypothetical protein